MKKKDRIYLFVFIGLFVAYVVAQYAAPKPINWAVTFHEDDKNPFGGFITRERFPDLFPEVETSFNTLTQLHASKLNVVVLAQEMALTEIDQINVDDMIRRGNSVFLAAHEFPDEWLDTLGLKVSFEFYIIDQSIFGSELVRLTNQKNGAVASYPLPMMQAAFEPDTPEAWETIVTNADEQPVVIRKKSGNGQLILCSAPLLFTNFGLLYQDNYRFAESILTLMPEQPTHISYFYQLGRPERQTPLRYLLSQEALKWGFYLGLLTLLIVFVVDTRRRQKMIPVVLPPENTTLTYVKTLGNLYFQEGNHKDLAEKIIRHFVHQVREKYFLPFEPSPRFSQLLAARSGCTPEDVDQALAMIAATRKSNAVKGSELLALAHHLNSIIK